MRRATGLVGEVLLTLGVLLLLFAAWQLWWTDVVSDRESARVVEELRGGFAGRTDADASSAGAGVRLADGAFALVLVPRFGAEWVRPVFEGTGLSVLAKGVGHYVGSAEPGQVGNFAVAGHRTTHGRPFHDIDALRPGDRVVVQTAEAVYVYAVSGHEVVDPSDVRVIAPVPDEPGSTPTEALLTMTSCDPPFRATQRYVVHARLAETLPAGRADEALSASPAGG
jgi:sortase A